MGMTSLKDLKKVLQLKFGNMYRAWNHHLDKDGSGSLTFLEFCEQLRALGYAGDLRAIWDELDEDDGGTITFVEFCPKEAVLGDVEMGLDLMSNDNSDGKTFAQRRKEALMKV